MRGSNNRQPSDTPGNIFNINESAIQVRNQPDSVLIGKRFTNVHVLTSEKNVRVIACCYENVGQFLPQDLIFKGVNKKQDLTDSLPPVSDVYINCKSSYISTHLFSKFSEGNSLNTASQRGSFYFQMNAEFNGGTLVLRTTVENNVLSFVYRFTLLTPYSSRISVLLGP